MRAYKKFLDATCKVLQTIAAFLFILIFLTSVIEIILRNVFNYSLLWQHDFCHLLTGWTMLLGAAALIRRDDHLVVDFLIKKIPDKYRTVVQLFTRLVLLAFCIILGRYGTDVAKVKMGLYYTSLRWPTGIAYMSLPVFGVLASLFTIDKIFDLIKELARNKRNGKRGDENEL